MAASNEATVEELDLARRQGDSYRRGLEAMEAEAAAVTCRAGEYLVAFVTENAEGMYEKTQDGLVWREAADNANVHMEVAVADAGDGRFVPDLSVHVEVERQGQPVLSTDLPYLWHPFLYHYGGNAAVPDAGPFDVNVQIGPATFMRHDPINGRRFAEPVRARFEQVQFRTGRKTSPQARPRGTPAPTAGVNR